MLENHDPCDMFWPLAPYEAWRGKMSAVGYLRTFGGVAYTKDLT